MPDIYLRNQQLDDELRRGALLSEHAQIAEEVAAAAAAPAQAAADGERRLRVVAEEMQLAVRELEASYYGCTVRG